jgi:hypothetical protein
VGLSTGCELGSGGGLLGFTTLACWGTGLFGGGGLGAGGFGLGAGGFFGTIFLGLILLGLGVAAACALSLACSLACAHAAPCLDQVLCQSVKWTGLF